MNLAEYINESRKVIKKEGMKQCRLAILSNFSVNGLGETLKVLCNKENIYVESYTPSYNQYVQEILNKSSNLYNFNPDIIFLLIDGEYLLREIYNFPYRLTSTEREEYINKKFQEIKELIIFLEQNTKSKIIINNLLLPVYSSRGILEEKQEYGFKKSIQDMNKLLEDLSKNDSQLFVFDVNTFTMKEGNSIKDWKMHYLADMRFSPNSLISLAEEYMAYIFPLMSLTKKCIVLDLDNTLWGGIIGEEGIAKIKLGPEKDGKPFYDFQKKLLELSERGILLAINSKNNPKDALEVINNHPYMLLRENNFVSVKINWNDKVKNLQEIAKELNIGLDSLVFIDDDKTNRELVKELLPEVFVLELSEDPCEYVTALEKLKIFNSFSITKEDLEKREMYLTERKRDELKSKSINLESFLERLELKITILGVEEENISRVSQLTQKTNQFNLTTKRYTEEEIMSFLRNKEYLLKLIQVNDRFGDYGTTGLVIIKKIDSQNWEIDNFLLSCRILGKNIEFAFLQELIEEGKRQGVKQIIAKFIPTEKNALASNFLEQVGFILTEKTEKVKGYILNIGEEIKKQVYGEIKSC